ncbi:putative ammonium transporter 1 isoform X2 [Rhopilema esculentum]|uniref:putative ammonium transporter 1 isoform X2 n=1 Tax=Rhopilema esculentum TaxID=499914 RepID=UPI0031E17746
MNSTVLFLNFDASKHQTVLATIAALLGGSLGFTLLHVGLCQPKNTSSILIHNLVCAILFVTIVNGGFVERMRFPVYIATTIFLAGFVYPIGCHWSWHQNGWLYHGIGTAKGQRIRFIDRGGSAAFHLSAGSIALFAGIFLKPRKERRGVFKLQFVGGQTNINIFIGGLAAMISILAKNIVVNSDAPTIAIINSVVAGCTSSLVAIMFKRSRIAGENWNTKTLLNGAFTGLVAVSAKPHKLHPYAAFGLGMVAGIAYIGWSVGLKHFAFDDVVDTVTVHLGGGACGVFAASLLDRTEGLLYNGSNESFKSLGWSLVALLSYIIWNGLSISLILLPFHHLGRLTYNGETVQRDGIDNAIFNEPANPKVGGRSAVQLQTTITAYSNDNEVNHNGLNSSDNNFSKSTWSPTTSFS